MMKVKKSLEMAKAEALKLSEEHPTILYRVMDKKGQMAVCTGSDWVYRERVRDGWFTVAAYQNGSEVAV